MKIRRQIQPISLKIPDDDSEEMMAAVHFIISILMAFSLELKFKRKYLTIVSLGFLGMLPDLDHFIAPGQNIGLFHNLLFLGILPLLALIMANLVETSGITTSSKLQRFFIAANIILVGHLILDLIAGNTISLGLGGSMTIGIQSMALIQTAGFGTVLTSADLLWMVLLILVLAGNIITTKIFHLFEGSDAIGVLEVWPGSNVLDPRFARAEGIQ